MSDDVELADVPALFERWGRLSNGGETANKSSSNAR